MSSKAQPLGPSESIAAQTITKSRKRTHAIRENEEQLRIQTLTKLLKLEGKRLVCLLDAKDCSIEMAVLRDVAIMAFSNAEHGKFVHERILSDAYGVFVRNSFKIDRRLLKRFQKLKLVVRVGGSTDNIDCRAAGELGIAVSHIPSRLAVEVAETTICYVLMLYRGVAQLSNPMPGGESLKKSHRRSGKRRICSAGSILGIVGLGRVGIEVAIRAKALGMEVIFFDPNLPRGIEIASGYTRATTLQQLLSVSHCVSLHCTLNEGSRRMIDATTLSMMKPGAFLVNTAHGELIQEEHLAIALKGGHLGGAALDVLESDLNSSPLNDAPNLFCGLQTASCSQQSDAELREIASIEMRRAVTGVPPSTLQSCVNRDWVNLSSFPTASTPPPIKAGLLTPVPYVALGTTLPPPVRPTMTTLPAIQSAVTSDDSITAAKMAQGSTLLSATSNFRVMPPESNPVSTAHAYEALQADLLYRTSIASQAFLASQRIITRSTTTPIPIGIVSSPRMVQITADTPTRYTTSESNQ